MSLKDEVKILRKGIKSQPGLSGVRVRASAGTAYGWVVIRGSGDDGLFTAAELRALKNLGFNPGSNFCQIPPEERKYWLEKLSGSPPSDQRFSKCGSCLYAGVECKDHSAYKPTSDNLSPCAAYTYYD